MKTSTVIVIGLSVAALGALWFMTRVAGNLTTKAAQSATPARTP